MLFNFSNVYRFEKIFCLNRNVVLNNLIEKDFSNVFRFEEK